MKKLTSLLCVLLLLALCLTGCANNPSTVSPTTAPTATDAPATAEPTATTEPAVSGEPTATGTAATAAPTGASGAQ